MPGSSRDSLNAATQRLMNATMPRWETMRTEETRRVNAYCYNSASIRVRVIDDRFEGLSNEARDDLAAPLIDRLPTETQADILVLLAISPDEIGGHNRYSFINFDFDDPSPSTL